MTDTIRTTTTATTTDRKGKKRADPPLVEEPATGLSPGKKPKKNPRQGLHDLAEKTKKIADKLSKGENPSKTMPRRPA